MWVRRFSGMPPLSRIDQHLSPTRARQKEQGTTSASSFEAEMFRLRLWGAMLSLGCVVFLVYQRCQLANLLPRKANDARESAAAIVLLSVAGIGEQRHANIITVHVLKATREF